MKLNESFHEAYTCRIAEWITTVIKIIAGWMAWVIPVAWLCSQRDAGHSSLAFLLIY